MQTNDHRISIIITSYNKRDYLVEAIDSVIGQTYRPYEIILADDGSTDGSRETIQDYMDRYPGWIKGIFQPENLGIPGNRNSALRIVTGNYVGILDGDDLFMPTKLEKQVAALQANPDARVVHTNFRHVEEDGVTEIELRFPEPPPQGDVLVYVAMFQFGLLRTLIADYELVQKAGFMDERYRMYDGELLTTQLASMCHFAYVDEPLVNKRKHPGGDSITNTDIEKLRERLSLYRDMQPLLARLDGRTIKKINDRWKKRLTKQLNKI